MGSKGQIEPMGAWIIEETLPTRVLAVVIGTEADAIAKARELLKPDEWWISGPYDYSIAIKP